MAFCLCTAANAPGLLHDKISNMKFSIPFLLAVFLFSSLTACGSKGPLVLPEHKPAQDSAPAQKTTK